MSTIPSTGVLIWLSIKPLIRIAIPTICGFTLIKTRLLAPNGTKAFSAVILYITLPSLIFSKIVPSFNSSNVSQLGPLFATGFFYIILSGLLGIVFRAITPTPRKFRYGILAGYAFGNYGDLPTAVIQTLALSSPFKGQSDEALAIAYISIFILTVNLCMWPFRGLEVVRWDYTVVVDPVEELKIENGEQGQLVKWMWRIRRGRPMREDLDEAFREVKKDKLVVDKSRIDQEMSQAMKEALDRDAEIQVENRTPNVEPFPELEVVSTHQSSVSTHPSPFVRVASSIWSIVKSIASPPVISLLLSLVIALVPQIKTLFVYSADTTWHPVAIDGQPPLSILYSTASFLGAAQVPIGLLVLGASLAKIQVPRPVSKLPWTSILSMSFVRLCLLPIIGFFFVNGLSRRGVIVSHDNHVLRFTLTYMSCMPTGTIQLAYSQLFAPEGRKGDDNSATLSSYILAQYVVYVFASPILTAVSLSSIF
ncbi:hypothetical protein ACM66B_005629 [Microbotryomycetes sp. NB124-2]